MIRRPPSLHPLHPPRRPVRGRTPSPVLLVVVLGALLAPLVAACSSTPDRSADPRPNIVVITTDDQTLAELSSMPKVKRYLTDEGTNFVNSFASFPLCCPSRATVLTGRYAHNHGVLDNVAPDGGHDRLDHTQTLPVWLSAAGYATAHIGKYLNGYGNEADGYAPAVVPPGWDRWFGLIDPSTLNYFGFEVLDDGERRFIEDTDANYQTDVLADRAVADVEALTAEGTPFYLNIGVLAPHSGTGRGLPIVEKSNGASMELKVAAVPAPRHAGLFADATFPRTEAFFEPDMDDKPPEIRETRDRVDQMVADQGMADVDVETLVDVTYRSRLQSLQAADDLVERVVLALEEAGQLDNTVVVFTSDNGWLLGEHGLMFAKVLLYEESIRVPLVVRGPGFPAGRVATQPTANVDLTPTFLELADASAPWPTDGQSLLPLAADPTAGVDRALLLHARWEHIDARGIRLAGWSYVRYASGSVELYDLFNDPLQLENQAGNALYAGVQARLDEALDVLVECAGPTCAVTVPGNELRGA